MLSCQCIYTLVTIRSAQPPRTKCIVLEQEQYTTPTYHTTLQCYRDATTTTATKDDWFVSRKRNGKRNLTLEGTTA
eukprot:16424-Heterococcus_DN1.PRE.1